MIEKCLYCGHQHGVVRKNFLKVLRGSYLAAAWIFALLVVFLIFQGILIV
ncbi:MAG: hypothetical protein Q8N08_04525 [Methanobacteriaceae archaeon]|nr:hypothetical protein [Methanobacteriaceae archaeon]